MSRNDTILGRDQVTSNPRRDLVEDFSVSGDAWHVGELVVAVEEVVVVVDFLEIPVADEVLDYLGEGSGAGCGSGPWRTS